MNTLFRTNEINKAVYTLSRSGEQERGAVFTKKEVVEFILDLSGYISGNTFVVEYTTDNDGLDTNGWDSFLKTHLELDYIDVR